MRITDCDGPLPSLSIDWTLPAPLILGSISAALAGMAPRIKLTAVCVELPGWNGDEIGIPAVCEADGEKWLIYLENGPWTPRASAKFESWMRAVRAIPELAQASVRIYSPRRMAAAAQPGENAARTFLNRYPYVTLVIFIAFVGVAMGVMKAVGGDPYPAAARASVARLRQMQAELQKGVTPTEYERLTHSLDSDLEPFSTKYGGRSRDRSYDDILAVRKVYVAIAIDISHRSPSTLPEKLSPDIPEGSPGGDIAQRFRGAAARTDLIQRELGP